MPKISFQISTSQETLKVADEFAKSKGLSRSRLFELAVLRVLPKADLTETS